MLTIYYYKTESGWKNTSLLQIKIKNCYFNKVTQKLLILTKKYLLKIHV